MSTNGLENNHSHESTDKIAKVTVPQNTLRRLAKLYARQEGSVTTAQAAINAAQAAQATLQSAIQEACEEEGLKISSTAQASVDINWKTGEITVEETSAPPSAASAQPIPPYETVVSS